MERPYEKLIAWQEAYQLCLLVYTLTKKFPSDEKFGLISQMRRSSSSAPFNIAEGNRKKSTKEKAHFLEIALCTLEELHCESKLSLDLGYIDQTNFENLDDRISRTSYLIYKLQASLS
ncbi:MAG: four helix bundle protein [Candidatus Peribacteraceae bacterium]|nr:four helix bundle protein [Candidatus Peribacteraceae bacterium]